MPATKKAVKPKMKTPVKKTGGKSKSKPKQVVKGLSLKQKAILASMINVGKGAAVVLSGAATGAAAGAAARFAYDYLRSKQLETIVLETPPPVEQLPKQLETIVLETPPPVEQLPNNL